MSHRALTAVLLAIAAMLTAVMPASAQSYDKIYMHKGNRDYRDKDFTTAEVNYRKSLSINNKSARTHYNMGNALLQQHKPKEAMQEYEKAVPLEKNPYAKAGMYHNMGVILQSQKQFAQAIECYKNALLNNPHDDETRYNLALCKHQLKNDNQDQNQQNQDKQDQDKNQQDKQQQQPQPQQDPQQKQQQKSSVTKENADQLLNAAMQKENKTQEKVRKAQPQKRRQLENNW